MLGAWRKTTASLVLGVVASPWPSVALVALHLEGHARSKHDATRAEASATGIVHGHSHDASTPEHHHHVTAPASAPLPVKPELTPAPAAILRAIAAVAEGPVRFPEAASSVGHDPPRCISSVSILRI
jgi:hypothetical protein